MTDRKKGNLDTLKAEYSRQPEPTEGGARGLQPCCKARPPAHKFSCSKGGLKASQLVLPATQTKDGKLRTDLPEAPPKAAPKSVPPASSSKPR